MTSLRKNRSTLRELHDRLGGMIDQVGHPDYSLRELVVGLRGIRDDLLLLAHAAAKAKREKGRK